jgi:ABC-type uncharacterized transport system permease subunit
MAKKKQTRKHRFKYATPEVGVEPVASGATNVPRETAARPVAPRSSSASSIVAANTRDFSYVGHDLRRVAVLSVALVGLEVLLWYLFNHTALGPAVYQMVKV